MLAGALIALAAPAAASAAKPTAEVYGSYSDSATTSIVYGAFDGQGQATTYQFGYDLASSTWCTANALVGAPGHTTASKPDEDDGFAYDTLTGLTAGTKYCVALIATNASGSTTSAPIAFTQGAPFASTDSAQSTSATTTVIDGEVYGAGQATTYRVQYDLKSSTWCTAQGASGAPANSTAAAPVPPPDNESHSVSVTLTGLTAGTAYCAAVSATNAAGTASSTPVQFVQGQPQATTWYAEPDSATTAVVNGAVNPAGQQTTYDVGWDLASSTWCTGDGSGAPGHTTSPQSLAETDATDHQVTVNVTGLTGGTAYCARLIATNGSGTSPAGTPEQFTAGLPRVGLGDWAPAGATSQQISGWVKTLGQSTTYRAAYDVASSEWCSNWGESGTPANTTPAQSLTQDNGSYNEVSVTLTGLSVGTTYCAALVATNGSGTATSNVEEFTQGAPRVEWTAVDSTTATTSTVSAQVNPAGQSTTYHVAYDVATSAWCASGGDNGTTAHVTSEQPLPFTDLSRHRVEVELAGLTAGAAYCTAVVAHSAGGTATDWPRDFTQGAPEAQTGGVHPTSATTARVEGSVDPAGQATTYRVSWDSVDSDWCSTGGDDPTIGPAHSTTAQPLDWTDTTDHEVVVDIAGLVGGQQYCAAIVAANGSGTDAGYPPSFTAGVPEAQLDDARSTGLTTATVTGALNPAGQATTFHVGYDTDESDWCLDGGESGTPAHTTPDTALDATDGTLHDVSVALSGLTAGEHYCAVLFATNATGESHSWPLDLLQGTPSAVVTDVVATGGTTARVTGTVNAAAQATTYRVAWDVAGSDWCFDDGWSGTPAHTTAAQPLAAADGSDQPVSIDITGLAPRTRYCVAITATNATGERTSPTATFISGSDAPTVATLAATAITATGASLNGTVAPHGTATTYRFEYGPTTDYGSTTPATSAGDGNDAKGVSASVGGLTKLTTYHYRLVATNAGGTTAGPDRTFTTSDAPAGDPPNEDPPTTSPPVDGPPSSGPPVGGSSSNTPAADTAAPHIAASLRSHTKGRLLRKKGVAINVGCDERCTATVTLTIPARLARKLGLSPAIGTASRVVDAGSEARLTVRLTRDARANLAHARGFRLTVVVSAQDRAGNHSSVTRTVLVSA